MVKIDDLIMQGGATLDPKTLQPAKLARGYMVSVKGCETTLYLNGENVKALSSYIEEYAKIASQKNGFVGVWVNEGVIYLDVSIRVKNLISAKIKGRKWDQIAIYNLKRQKTITL